ncbi:MAG: MFS transporter [Geminicoccaceae bacterium]
MTGGRWPAFRHAGYKHYWLARFLSTFAVQITSVSVAWQIYDITRDPLDLGLVGLIQFAPSLLLVLVTGAAADRFGRRTIMALALLGEGICAVALLFFALKGIGTVWPIFVVLAGFGLSRAFFNPASSSLVANLVPASDLANAIALNTTAWQVATIVGPVVGGLIYGISASAAYAVAVAMFFLAGVLTVRIPRPASRQSAEPVRLETILAGFRYIWREPVVLGAVSLDLFAVLLGGAIALMPVYARDILVLGPWGLGLLRAAPGIGAVLVGFWLTFHPLKDHAGVILLVLSACSASPPPCSVSPKRHGFPSWHFSSSAVATWSASMCVRR